MLSCSAVKNLNKNEYLLEKNIISKDQKELINDPLYLLLKGKPNKKIIGMNFKILFTINFINLLIYSLSYLWYN